MRSPPTKPRWPGRLPWTKDATSSVAVCSSRKKAQGAPRQLIGVVMDDKGVLRHGQAVFTASGEGEILSGTFSPTLGKAIAFARVPAGSIDQLRVDIRGKQVPLRAVKFPFVRDGQAQPGVLGD